MIFEKLFRYVPLASCVFRYLFHIKIVSRYISKDPMQKGFEKATSKFTFCVAGGKSSRRSVGRCSHDTVRITGQIWSPLHHNSGSHRGRGVHGHVRHDNGRRYLQPAVCRHELSPEPVHHRLLADLGNGSSLLARQPWECYQLRCAIDKHQSL